MSKLKKVFSVAAAAALALSMMILPAQAATAPAAGNCIGVADVSPGLFAPGFGPDQTFDWTLTTECTSVSADGVETFTLEASGTGHGWCGHSTASGGSGTLSNASQTINLTNIGWLSGGSLLLVTANHDAGGTGNMVAEVEAQGGSDCTTPGGATTFDVVIQAEFG